MYSGAYATGYLGDIGVPILPCPMDFSGWFEVYLGSQWHTFDARHNVPRVGRVLLRGRDAADVAMITSFGKNTLQRFKVWTDEVVGADSLNPIRPTTIEAGQAVARAVRPRRLPAACSGNSGATPRE